MPPSSVDNVAQQTPVVDQGFRNTCLAVAATGGHEALRSGLGLSIEHLIDNAANREGFTVHGATMTSIRDGIVLDGQCETDRWPYGATVPTPRPADVGQVYQASLGEVLTFDLDQLRQGLADGWAVVLGFHLTDPFLDGARLPIKPGTAGEPRHGRHAVLVVGYDDDLSTITIKNSWGTDWAEAGYATVAYGYLAAHAISMMRLAI